MDWLQTIILGIVQGVTEFLPVSSSGHLVIAEALFEATGAGKLSDAVEFNIFLHAGTLAALLVYYRREVTVLWTTDRRVVGLLAVGTLPAIVVGVPLKLSAGRISVLESPLLTGFFLVATGMLLIWSGRAARGSCEYQKLTYGRAVLIGGFQAFAILPGLSRSGWTISAGLMLGLRRDAAVTFSFLLAIPAIAGATILEIFDLLSKQETGTPVSHLAAGVAISFVVGLACLRVLVRVVRRGRLQWFAAWCIPVGLAVILWQLSS
ncbi:MAG: undecaprenyl-diphosphate phosphatase [Pirellulales bacterium]